MRGRYGAPSPGYRFAHPGYACCANPSYALIARSLERDRPLNKGGGFYHSSVKAAVDRDGDTLTVLDVLAKQVGVRGMFSDWPATTTFYASCMEMK
ncbi:hypothetical protein V1282_001635 [Nitrobacteraceae bacterium AZCC 2146]